MRRDVIYRGQTVTLTRPASAALRMRLALAADGDLFGQVACLAVCLPGVMRPPVDFRRYRHEPKAYGEEVFDAWASEGVRWADIREAVGAAVDLVADGVSDFFAAEELAEEVRGNSTSPEGEIGGS